MVYSFRLMVSSLSLGFRLEDVGPRGSESCCRRHFVAVHAATSLSQIYLTTCRYCIYIKAAGLRVAAARRVVRTRRLLYVVGLRLAVGFREVGIQ